MLYQDLEGGKKKEKHKDAHLVLLEVALGTNGIGLHGVSSRGPMGYFVVCQRSLLISGSNRLHVPVGRANFAVLLHKLESLNKTEGLIYAPSYRWVVLEKAEN